MPETTTPGQPEHPAIHLTADETTLVVEAMAAFEDTMRRVMRFEPRVAELLNYNKERMDKLDELIVRFRGF